MKQIDHDPRELPRKAIKLVAIATAVITLMLIIPISIGIRWSVERLPFELVLALGCLAMGASGGFFIGRWDALRHSRTPNTDG
jgi:hypothetical protein